MSKFSCNLIGSQTEKKLLKAFTALSEFESIEIEGRSLGLGYGVLQTQKVGAIIGCKDDALMGILKHLKDQGVECRGVSIVEEEADNSDAPLEVLDLSVTKLRQALATGDYDLYLEALLDAEQAGKTRKTAVEAIQERLG
tara:strand:+ start:1330 stop:1749 length:420 start_codon:yes stop_codon:yes gene_type:complete